jgi:hypothetical protein
VGKLRALGPQLSLSVLMEVETDGQDLKTTS